MSQLIRGRGSGRRLRVRQAPHNESRCVALDAPVASVTAPNQLQHSLTADAVTCRRGSLQPSNLQLHGTTSRSGRVPHGESTRRPLRGARLRQLLRLAAQRARVPRHAHPHGQRARPRIRREARMASTPHLNRVRRRPSLEPSRPGGIPRRHRPCGAARVAPLLPRCPRRRRSLRRARRRAARPTGRSASADDLRSVQRPAAVPAAMEGAEPQRAPG